MEAFLLREKHGFVERSWWQVGSHLIWLLTSWGRFQQYQLILNHDPPFYSLRPNFSTQGKKHGFIERSRHHHRGEFEWSHWRNKAIWATSVSSVKASGISYEWVGLELVIRMMKFALSGRGAVKCYLTMRTLTSWCTLITLTARAAREGKWVKASDQLPLQPEVCCKSQNRTLEH